MNSKFFSIFLKPTVYNFKIKRRKNFLKIQTSIMSAQMYILPKKSTIPRAAKTPAISVYDVIRFDRRNEIWRLLNQ